MPRYDFPLSFMELITLGKRPMGRSTDVVVDYLAKQEVDRATPLLVLGVRIVLLYLCFCYDCMVIDLTRLAIPGACFFIFIFFAVGGFPIL